MFPGVLVYTTFRIWVDYLEQVIVPDEGVQEGAAGTDIREGKVMRA